MLGKTISIAVLAIFLAPRLWLSYWKLPTYASRVPHYELKNIWSDQELEDLRQMVKDIPKIPATISDVTIPESLEVCLPRLPNGDCPHPLLFRAVKEQCALPQRIDVVRHHSAYGGRYGAKLTFIQMQSNQNIHQYILFGDDLKRPQLSTLFDSPEYRQAASAVCGKDNPVQKRIQLTINLIMPGQELPMHFDLPWFKNGANRFNTPQWLLLAMSESGLWDDLLLQQVQGSAYIHHYNGSSFGGEFFVYDQGPGQEATVIPPETNSAIVMDGVKVPHGVDRFMPGREAPQVGGSTAFLKYSKENDRFELKSNDKKEEILATTKFEEMRLSLIWRTICFENEEQERSWNPQTATFDPEIALQALENDLRKRGILDANEPPPPPLDFALLLLDEYVKYPVDNFHSSWFPLNYCMLPYITANRSIRKILQAGVNLICW